MDGIGSGFVEDRDGTFKLQIGFDSGRGSGERQERRVERWVGREEGGDGRGQDGEERGGIIAGNEQSGEGRSGGGGGGRGSGNGIIH